MVHDLLLEFLSDISLPDVGLPDISSGTEG